jgi:hypothetical protein
VTDEIVPVHPISVIGELEDQLLGHDVAIAFIIAAATPVGTLPYMTAPVLGEPRNLPPPPTTMAGEIGKGMSYPTYCAKEVCRAHEGKKIVAILVSQSCIIQNLLNSVVFSMIYLRTAQVATV